MSNAEMELLRVGSVVRKGKMFRVCREVHRWKTKKGKKVHIHVTFAIRRRSWTGRPYTVYGVDELRRLDYVGTPATVSLCGAIDRELYRNIKDCQYRTLTPEDMRGIP